MEFILNFIPNLKIFYLILIILVMIIINIILNKKKISSSYKYLINGIALISLALITNYFNDIIEGIFNLKFLSVKFYLIILIIVNIITIINKKFSQIYRIINYLLYSLIMIILAIILIITTCAFLQLIDPSITNYNIILINISLIIFIIYLVFISTIYIVKTLKNNKETNNLTPKENILSKEELLSLPNKDIFNIRGVECSIIFEDSIPENIIKNYHILLNDINAKLVNGYTLEENKMLKSICTKLQTNKLNLIDLNNLSILNKISVEEYKLLKQIYEE